MIKILSPEVSEDSDIMYMSEKKLLAYLVVCVSLILVEFLNINATPILHCAFK